MSRVEYVFAILCCSIITIVSTTLSAQEFLYEADCGPGHGALSYAVAASDDMDGDGTSDFVVGQPTLSQFRLISGRTGSVIRDIFKLPRYGASLALVRDFDGDGLSEMAVGSDSTGHGVEIYSLKSGTALAYIPSSLCSVLSCKFGSSIALVKDMDNDGIPDIAISDPTYSLFSNGTIPGSINFYSGFDLHPLAKQIGLEFEGLGETIANLGPYLATSSMRTEGEEDFHGSVKVFDPVQISDYSNAPYFSEINFGSSNEIFGNPLQSVQDLTGDSIAEFTAAAISSAGLFNGATGQLLKTTSGAFVGVHDNDSNKNQVAEIEIAGPSQVSISIKEAPEFSNLRQNTFGIPLGNNSSINAFALGDLNKDGATDMMLWQGLKCFVFSSKALGSQNSSGNGNKSPSAIKFTLKKLPKIASLSALEFGANQDLTKNFARCLFASLKTTKKGLKIKLKIKLPKTVQVRLFRKIGKKDIQVAWPKSTTVSLSVKASCQEIK